MQSWLWWCRKPLSISRAIAFVKWTNNIFTRFTLTAYPIYLVLSQNGFHTSNAILVYTYVCLEIFCIRKTKNKNNNIEIQLALVIRWKPFLSSELCLQTYYSVRVTWWTGYCRVPVLFFFYFSLRRRKKIVRNTKITARQRFNRQATSMN